MSNDEIAQEQEYLSMLYRGLDEMRADADRSLTASLAGDGQVMVERDARVAHYTDRLARLRAAERGLCFGRVDRTDGSSHHIGRTTIHGEEEPLLIDWRAPAARPFYVATAVSPEGLVLRRHINTRQRRVVSVDDEILSGSPAGTSMVGEAALLSAVGAARTGRMSDIVATIQAEQDEIIRSGHLGVLVVDGGPGTGKTAVALHRAAYLLYTHPHLARRGVLVVGPSATFLRYIGQVLPGLGETNVLLSTVGELYPGIRPSRVEDPAVAELKGRASMAELLANAVRDRQVPADRPAEILLGGEIVPLDGCERARDLARSSLLPHNQARAVFAEAMLDGLAARRADRLRALALDTSAFLDLPEALPEAEDPDLLDTHDVADLRRELAEDPDVAAALDALWPTLSPERLLSELFAGPDRIGAAGPWLSQAERELLCREGRGWSLADIPLLDEAAELLGRDDRARRAAEDRELDEQIAYAEGVLEILSGSRSTDLEEGEESEMLTAVDLLNAESLAGRHEHRSDATVAERAAADREWAFGHVIVDEAQELSEMAWRLLMRRCPSRSMTVVGDVAQTADPAGTTSWRRVLQPHVGDRWRHARLTVGYRTPAEIMAVAATVLAAHHPGQRPPSSVRSTGERPWRLRVDPAELPARLAERVAASATDEKLAVIVPSARLAEIAAVLPEASSGADPDLTRPVVVLGERQAKGLEFDTVIVVEPAAMGAADLYVALTRATRRLGVVHTDEAAAPLDPGLLERV